MYRYVGFIWNVSNTLAGQAADQLVKSFIDSHTNWNYCCNTPGMLVFAPNSVTGTALSQSLPGSRGTILGRLFPGNEEHWRKGWRLQLHETLSTRMVATGGSALATEFWGSYIAFMRDAHDDINYVLRDCSGKFPCYFATVRDVSIIFGDINDLDGISGMPRFELDTQYISAFIYSSELQVNQCAIRGVTEVLAGQRLRQKHGQLSITSFWDPREVVRSEPLTSFAEAQSALRSTTEYCVAAWASTYSTIVHSLSGGLDSAIVLGCLSRTNPKPDIICVNRFHAVPGEDERFYARSAATLTGFQLIEHPWCSTNQPFDESLLEVPRTPKPYVPLPFSLLDANSWNEVTARYRAQAVWTGEGGDHIFFNVPTALGASDYIQTNGPLSPGTVSAVLDSARYSREPYFNVWRKSIGLARSRKPWKSHLWAARTNGSPVSFLQYESLPNDADQYIMHPWFSHREDLPKGKQLQIEVLLELLNRHRFSPALLFAPEHHPLISQPLLELSLRIPIYLLTAGGRQRQLAREAFRQVVPPEILAREGKGSTGVLWMTKIRESQRFLSHLLLDGWLAKYGIIDRPSLEPYLVNGQPIRPEQWSPLAACIAAEIWIRSWKFRQAPTAHPPNFLSPNPTDMLLRSQISRKEC